MLRYHGPFPYPQAQNKFYVIVEEFEFIYTQQSESSDSQPQPPTGKAGEPSELSSELIHSVAGGLTWMLPSGEQTIAIKDAADWVNYTVEPSENGFGVILSSPHTRKKPSLPTQVWRNTLYPIVRVQRYRNGSREIYGIGAEIPLFVGDTVSIPLFYPSEPHGSEPSARTPYSDNRSTTNEQTNARTSENLSGSLRATQEQQMPPSSERYYVTQFLQLLKANANKRLDENRNRIVAEEVKYNNTNPENPQWQRLRQVIEKDQELARHQKLFESQKSNIERSINDLNLSAGSLLWAGLEAVDAQYTQPLNELQQQQSAFAAKIEELKQVRNALRSFYPAVAVLKTEDITPSMSNEDIGRKISAGFAEILKNIDEVRKKIETGDIPLNNLDPIVEQTKQQMGVTEAKRKEQDPISTEVLKWLDAQERKDFWINLGGTLASITLGVAAFFATGGTAIFLGIAAALTGLGTAAYEFEKADDLYAASRTSEAGGKPLVGDPDAARFNYIMGWVNLVLAGLDVGFAAKAGTTLLKGARAAERIAGMRGAAVLSQLQPEEIGKFDQAMQLQRAGQAKEAQAILDELKSGLKARFNDEGEEIFAQANSVFQRTGLAPAQVSELNGFKNVLPNDLLHKVSIQVDPNLTGNTVRVYYELEDGLVSNIDMLVGSRTGVRDIQLHVPTVRLMQRYSGISGRVRVLLERIRSLIDEKGTPPVGSLAWEAKLEIEKLPRIVNERVQQLAGNTLDTQASSKGNLFTA